MVFPTTITFASGSWSGNYEYRKTLTESTSVFYERYVIGGAASTPHGIEFRKENDGSTKVYCNTDNNTGSPVYVSVGNGNYSSVTIVEDDDLQGLWSATDKKWEFVVTNDMIWPTGPTVTQTRTTHTGSIPFSTNFTIRAPTGLSYEKIGVKKFRLKFYDQNEIANYNLTVTWNTATGTNTTTQQVVSNNGDLQMDIETNDIVSGSITLSINYNVFAMTNFGLMQIAANNVFDTFQYIEKGPFTASFSPASGQLGQNIGFTITDTNPFPDSNSTYSIDHPSYTNIANGTLQNANNFTSNNSTAFTSVEGTYTITVNNSAITTANYGVTASNGGGKRRRYPIISTNLFDRQKSIYSIGLTHKDETLF